MIPIEDTEHPFCYVTTTGRRTGNPHTIEIWFAAPPTRGCLYILTYERSDTVRNLRRNPEAKVQVGGRNYPMAARVVAAGTEEDARARRMVVDKYHSRGGSDLESWGATALVVAFDLTTDE